MSDKSSPPLPAHRPSCVTRRPARRRRRTAGWSRCPDGWRLGRLTDVAIPWPRWTARRRPTRQAQLQLVKLRALVSDHLGGLEDATPVPAAPFALGAGLLVRGEAWVLVAERAERSLGPALAWARQAGFPTDVTRVHLLAESATGLLARRAAQFDVPITVWQVDGRELHEAPAAPVTPPRTSARARGAARADRRRRGHPRRRARRVGREVHGLEVCRAVDGPDGTPRLEVGVGAPHDREAFGLVHGDLPTIDALADVVGAVAAHREPGAEPHPLNRLGAERALRGADRRPVAGWRAALRPAEPPVPRANVKDAVPCVAVRRGTERADARRLLGGVDLDVVPFAVDAWLTAGDPSAEIVIALPARDQLPVTDALAARASPPTRIAAQ